MPKSKAAQQVASVPKAISELIERFTSQLDAYKSGRYNEAQLRQEFLNPLFKALGWDIDNEQGFAEAYKDVIHEDAIRVGSAVKAPDYCFRVGGTRKFFLEAKKPSVDIKDEPTAAYQLRRYAWSAKLPLSILSDFEEFAVYDCRVRPEKNDSAATARIFFCTFRDYPEKWDWLVSVFSKDAIQKGSFDRFAESTKAKRGTSEVDTAFLAEIENWRSELARNLALRNPSLTQRELNFAVQRIIDRIIFLRICEDRGIEDYGRLLALTNGPGIYPRLGQTFEAADARYNSGLFHFRMEKDRREAPDELTLTLQLDDKLLRDILRGLYYPDSPYEFSVLSADILGQVYEQFLGKVIRLTAGHRGVVDDKPEVKKAGGVYYTPTYIVDYIVRQTVGKLVEGKTPKQVETLRILDPACGSGSFLIGSYQFLLDWHRDWYLQDGPQTHAKGRTPSLHQTSGGGWQLTVDTRKRILLNNIFGVDIDSQAVEVTKLSLLLKVLEGETSQSLQTLFRFQQQRALPDLGNNIKCGNSLIGPDFYQQLQMDLLDQDTRYRINVFDWAGASGFPQLMNAGGFDVVLGNPPYVRSQALGADQRTYYARRFRTATATYDIYVLFVERALSLMRKGGRVAFILPNKFFTTDYGEGLRTILTAPSNLIEFLVDFEDGQVFAGAGTYTCILLLASEVRGDPGYVRLGAVYRQEGTAGLAALLNSGRLAFQKPALSTNGARWTMAVGRGGDLLARLQEQYAPLSAFHPHMFQGLKTSADKIYLVTVGETRGELCQVTTHDGESLWIERDILKPVVKGEHVQRYHIDRGARLHIIYPYLAEAGGRVSILGHKTMSERFPLTWAYLVTRKDALGARDGGVWAQRADWYAYARSQNLGAFLGSKLLIPYMTTRLRVAPDMDEDLFFVNITTGGYGLSFPEGRHHDLYVVGLLNSKLLDYAIRPMTNAFRGGYLAVNKQAVERLPFRPIDAKSAADKSRQDGVVNLVEQMLTLHSQAAIARTPQEQAVISGQIAATDLRLDQLVYDLYGLTDDEIKVVEGKTA